MDLIFCFKNPLNKSGGGSSLPGVKEKTRTADDSSGRPIRCRQCRKIITTSAQRISVQGGHRHSFANPYGYLYEIGCFGTVTGCNHVGPPSSECTWFRGFQWEISYCGRCQAHLGWLFLSGGSSQFAGLILNRLVEGD